MEAPKSGDVTALLAHADWLTRLARHLVRDDVADDAVQETWLAASRSLPTAGRPPRPWLAEVLRNFIRKRMRAERRRDRRERAVADPVTEAPGADHLYERMEMQRLLAQRVMDLDEPFRRVVLLRYYEGRNATEIARTLGIPAGTVRWRLKEALDRLRTQLDDENGGDRRRWRSLLLPFDGQVATGLWKGSVLMAKTKVGVMAVIALGLALLAGLMVRQHRPPAGRDRVRVQEGTSGRGQGGLRVFGAMPAAPEAAGAIEGLVQDHHGRPIVGATVAASPKPDLMAGRHAPAPLASAAGRTDERGRFSLGRMEPATYIVVASAPGSLQDDPLLITVAAGETRRGLLLTLRPGGFLLSGHVLDSGHGPIAGALVQAGLTDRGVVTAVSDASGAYALSLPRGPHPLVVSADGYATRRQTVDMAGDLSRDVLLDPAARITGRVVSQATGEPVRGALVRADREEVASVSILVSSDERGRFAFASLDPGAYQLSARLGAAVGFRTGKLAVTSAGHVDDIVITLEPAFAIIGRVLAPDGQPVGGAHLWMEESKGFEPGVPSGPAVASSRSDGRYRVEGVLPGRFWIGAKADRHGPSRARALEVGDGDVSVDIVLAPGAGLSGVVIAHDGRPVARAEVSASVRDANAEAPILRSEERAFSDTSGRFSIEGLGAGTLRVAATHADHGSVELTPATLSPGEQKQVKLTFGAPSFIEGTVRWDDGGPARGGRVRWFGAVEATTLVGAEGRFRLGPLAKGPGEVQAELASAGAYIEGGKDAPHKRRITLGEGETVKGVMLVLARPDKTISGIVLDPEGRPLPDARVLGWTGNLGVGDCNVLALVRPEGVVTSQEDGRFIVRGLESGTYTVCALRPEFSAAIRPGVATGSTDVRLRFAPAASVSGVATDSRGQPVSDYTIAAIPPESPGRHNGGGAGVDIGTRVRVRQAGGAFVLEPLAAGRHDLVLTTPDGRAGRVPGLNVAAGERKRGVQVVVGPSATIKGRVVDADTGQALPGLDVGVRGNRERTHGRTDASGWFAIEGQVPGRTLVIEVHAPAAYLWERRELTLPSGQTSVETTPIRLLRRAPGTSEGVRASVGIATSAREGPAIINRITPGSSAARAALRPGDRLVTVGGRDVAGLGPLAVASLLSGPENSKVEVVIEAQGRRQTLSLERTDRDGANTGTTMRITTH